MNLLYAMIDILCFVYSKLKKNYHFLAFTYYYYKVFAMYVTGFEYTLVILQVFYIFTTKDHIYFILQKFLYL